MQRQTIIEHGPRRLWWAPWRQVCRCGLGAWPCYAQRMLERQARLLPLRAPDWNSAPTVLRAPLLTPGQAARTRQAPQS